MAYLMKGSNPITKKKKGKGLKSACWVGYEAVGFKMKNGRKVPNCVPIKKKSG